jgi:acyl-CoA thioesterase-1
MASALVFSAVTPWAQEGGVQKKRPPQTGPLAPVVDAVGLPRVLLIGDSISIGYTVPVRVALEGVANVHRPPENCESTIEGLAKIDRWLGDKPWDLIHFNWGLHDLKFLGPNGENLADPTAPESRQKVPVAAYEANLRKLVARLQETGAALVWRNTTPVPAGVRGRIPGAEVEYNAAAAKVMKDAGVPTDDLYSFAIEHQEEIQKNADVHFTRRGSERLAAHVADTIKAGLAGRGERP